MAGPWDRHEDLKVTEDHRATTSTVTVNFVMGEEGIDISVMGLMSS